MKANLFGLFFKEDSRTVSLKITWIAVFLLLFPKASLGQSDNAQISGFVRDASGAVLPETKILVKSETKNFERNTATNSQGYFVIPDLAPDVYSVNAEHSGFKRFALSGKKLDPSMATTVNITLQLGEVNQEVTVTAASASLQTETATLGKLVEREQIDLTEVNGRNPIFLALTKPGVVGNLNGVATNSFGLTTGGFNINGSRSVQNVITYDGSVGIRTRSNDTFSIGTADSDSTQELQVLTANYDAEYGRSAGGQIRVVSKSGTKDFHGRAFEYLRNSAFNANTWTRNANPQPGSCDQLPRPQQCVPAPFRYNQFGYTLDGPVLIPFVDYNKARNKLFFSFGQEWVTLRNDTLRQLVVPSVKMRQGDFSELAVANTFTGAPRFIKDPLKTGNCNKNDQTACFQDQGILNRIPADRLSPNGMALLNAYPLPITGFLGPNGTNWQADRPNSTDQIKSTIGVDFNPSANHFIRGRAQLFNSTQHTAFPFGGDTGLTPRLFKLPDQWASINYVWTISPKWVNEALIAGSKDRVETLIDSSGTQFARSSYGINYPYIFPQGKNIPDKIPSVDMSSFGSLNGGPYPSHSSGPIYQFSDNMTRIDGNHTLKFGAYFEYSGENDNDQINVAGTPGGTNNQNGRFVFSNTTPGGTSTAIANAALGLFDTYAEIGPAAYTPYRGHMLEWFVQDSWKATPNLTLQLGLRDSIITPHYSLFGNMAVFDPSFFDPNHVVTLDPKTGFITAGDLQAQYNGLVIPGGGWPSAAKDGCRVAIACTGQFDFLFKGVPRQYADVHYTEFQPRAGIAYALGSRNVIRAGVGRFVDNLGVSDSIFLGGNPPLQASASITAGSVDNPGGKIGNRFPLQITSENRTFPNPEAWTWNGTYERSLGSTTVISLGYVGRRGLHLQKEYNINQLQPGTLQANPGVNTDFLRPFPGYSTIRVTNNIASSLYNSFQAEVTRRFTKGLSFEAAYTLSKSTDNGSAQRDILPNVYNGNSIPWAPSDFDRRHVLVATVIYELPFWGNRSALSGKLLGGWTVNAIAYFRRGTPFSVASGDDFAGVGPGSGSQYWNLTGPIRMPGQFSTSPKDQNFFIDPSAFSKPAAGTFAGNPARNVAYNPGDVTPNLAVFKDFRITERQAFQFRAEAFNFLNHPNWAAADNNPNDGTFGKISTKTGNREMQFALRYSF
jgi:hypothetical protein